MADVNLTGIPDNINIGGVAGDTVNYTDFGGNDTYTLLSNLQGDVNIDDNNGATINLPPGLDPDSIQFSATGVDIGINGHTVSINTSDTSSLSFVFGGTPLDPDAGVERSFADTAAAFGTSVPDSGASDVVNDPGTVQADGSVSNGSGGGGGGPTTQALETASNPFDAGTGSFQFTEDPSVAQVGEIQNFGSDDSIDIGSSGNEPDSVNFSSNENDIEIDVTQGNIVSEVALVGVNDGSPVFDEASAEQVLDFDAFDIAGSNGGGTPGNGSPGDGDTTAPSVTDVTFAVPEDAGDGTSVGTVMASDDTGVSSLAITGGNTDVDNDGSAAFALADDGTLTVNDGGDLDFEGQNTFNLNVEASDAAGNTGSGSVTVNVTDVDEGGGGTPTTQALENAGESVDAGTDSFVFTEDPSVPQTNEISNFGSNDQIQIGNTGNTADSVNFSSTANNIEVDVVQGQVVSEIDLVGVNDGSPVFNESTAESVLGFDAFDIA